MRDPSRVRVAGPLERYASGFVAELVEGGYARDSAAFQLRLMAHVSRWLGDEGLAAEDFSSAQVKRFLAARRAAGYASFLSPKGLGPVLGYLRALGVVPLASEPEPTSVQALLERYRVYLTGERGLSVGTVRGYVDAVRPFLEGRLDHRGRSSSRPSWQRKCSISCCASAGGGRCGRASDWLARCARCFASCMSRG